ncbi:MAG: UDP-glucose 4-epimerase [Patescibacteria group bacterium]|jgi:UDP-glucose 4-epimerase
MAVLVTGGAGYIGSVAVKQLIEKGKEVIVIDNLSKGMRELVHKDAIFYEGDLIDTEFVKRVFSEQTIDSVIHFGAYKAVGESMKDAQKYSNNILGAINLINSCISHNIQKLIFSSTAAVYGDVNGVINEETETLPINFYGHTKLEIEHLLDWYHRIYGLSYIAFRYFNVAGDDLGYIDPAAENIFPIIMEVITKERDGLTVFGNDYETTDGTCVRDYVDVRDLASAHLLGLESDYIGSLNLGSGNGFSVQELIAQFKELSQIDFPVTIGERRDGDPATLIANNEKVKSVLGWTPKRTLTDMISSTIAAYK